MLVYPCSKNSRTVNQHFFAAISFHIFDFMDIFLAIYFHGLQNWTMQEQWTKCQHEQILGNFFR